MASSVSKKEGWKLFLVHEHEPPEFIRCFLTVAKAIEWSRENMQLSYQLLTDSCEDISDPNTLPEIHIDHNVERVDSERKDCIYSISEQDILQCSRLCLDTYLGATQYLIRRGQESDAGIEEWEWSDAKHIERPIFRERTEAILSDLMLTEDETKEQLASTK